MSLVNHSAEGGPSTGCGLESIELIVLSPELVVLFGRREEPATVESVKHIFAVSYENLREHGSLFVGEDFRENQPRC